MNFKLDESLFERYIPDFAQSGNFSQLKTIDELNGGQTIYLAELLLEKIISNIDEYDYYSTFINNYYLTEDEIKAFDSLMHDYLVGQGKTSCEDFGDYIKWSAVANLSNDELSEVETLSITDLEDTLMDCLTKIVQEHLVY